MTNTFHKAMVINGHGSKTDTAFQFDGTMLLTPESLDESYVFSIDPNFHLENTFRNGSLPPVNNGTWHKYQKHASIPDVRIDPWKHNEPRDFAKRLLDDATLWSSIDNSHGLLYKRDPNSVLIVKTHQGYQALQGQALEEYAARVKANLHSGTPLVFMSPKLGKVKVLSTTSLSEITGLCNQFVGPTPLLLATCNAGKQPKTVGAQTHREPVAIDSLFPENKGFFWFFQNKQNTPFKQDIENLESSFSKLKMAG